MARRKSAIGRLGAKRGKGPDRLTEDALRGIRQMPPHGGNPDLTDFEIRRAITHMVNQSGGHWNEPINKATTPPERSVEQIVRAQCTKCHATGIGGHPGSAIGMPGHRD